MCATERVLVRLNKLLRLISMLDIECKNCYRKLDVFFPKRSLFDTPKLHGYEACRSRGIRINLDHPGIRKVSFSVLRK